MNAATNTNANATPSVLVWRWPWRFAMVMFFFFAVLWAHDVVIKRYWIDEGWDVALPGLGDSDLRKFTIRTHMTFGVIALLLSPIQMTTPFVKGWQKKNGTATDVRGGISNWYRTLHRYTGRVYIVCAILSFFFGQWFIILKEFRLVGGYNMGVAFSGAGFFIAYFAYMTWRTAPTRNINSNNNGGHEYTIEDHRNYAIRSFSQIIAPFLYRYEYFIVQITKIWETPSFFKDDPRGTKLVCDEHNVCDDYLRPFDAMFCWFYWMSAWAVAEIVIAYLPKHRRYQTSSSAPATTVATNETDRSPLLEEPLPQGSMNHGNDDNNDNDDIDDDHDDGDDDDDDDQSSDNFHDNNGNSDKKISRFGGELHGMLYRGIDRCWHGSDIARHFVEFAQH
mmetsp:Transcript_18163/g.37780  ORF Transcript_18163/g.37780 Transcript_18163/m.37780 type:complete len:392 (+) Transcript_18163:254-1429(+)